MHDFPTLPPIFRSFRARIGRINVLDLPNLRWLLIGNEDRATKVRKSGRIGLTLGSRSGFRGHFISTESSGS